MKVKRVIVDEIPIDCNNCILCTSKRNGGDYMCTIVPEDVGLWDPLPEWCPLELETVTETDIRMVEQAPHIEKSSKDTWQEMIDLLEKVNRKIDGLPKPTESHGT